MYIIKFINYIKTLNFNDWITILVLFMFIGIYVYVIYRSDKRIDEGRIDEGMNLLQIAEFIIIYIFIFAIVLIVMQKIFPSNILNDAVSFLTGE